jgi:prophage regulatory protein
MIQRATLPETGFVRLQQIVGQRPITAAEAAFNQEAKNHQPKRARAGIAPIIPIGRSQWLAGVASGRFPKPVKGVLGARVTAWRVEDIRALIASVDGAKG